MNALRHCLSLPVVLWLAAGAGALDSRANLDLEALVAEAWSNNPTVRAAQFEAERGRADRDALGGFFDPQLLAQGTLTAPVTGRRTAELQAGLDAALRPGVRIGTRVAERFLAGSASNDTPETGAGDLWQSQAGLTLDVPLLQDRGFRQWELADTRAARQVRQLRNRWLAVSQACRHDVEQGYIGLCEAEAQRQVTDLALARVEKLLKEAEALVRLRIVPEYQLFAARAEVALWREARAGALQACRQARLRLLQTLGVPPGDPPRVFRVSYDVLVLWADAVDLPPVYAAAAAFEARGDYLDLRDAIEVAEAERALEQDRLRDDLSLRAEASVQGEDPDRGLGSERLLGDRTLAGRIGITWKRPWGYQTEKARVRALDATVAERRELLRQAAIGIAADLRLYHEQFLTAQDRLALVVEAIGAARQALEAENERFCLGEGRSRNVLDAQKDLTDAQKRQIVIAVELLRAYARFRYAGGYAGGLAEN